jgi:hypothetical protein
LLDAYADPNGTDPGKHYGLFDYGNAPKPIATALHNLMQILGDSAASAGSFTTGVLDCHFRGGQDRVELPDAESSGVFDLVVWNEQTIWNATTKTGSGSSAGQGDDPLCPRAGDSKSLRPLAGTDPLSRSGTMCRRSP